MQSLPRTAGSRFVVSSAAIFDAEFHGLSLPCVNSSSVIYRRRPPRKLRQCAPAPMSVGLGHKSSASAAPGNAYDRLGGRNWAPVIPGGGDVEVAVAGVFFTQSSLKPINSAGADAA